MSAIIAENKVSTFRIFSSTLLFLSAAVVSGSMVNLATNDTVRAQSIYAVCAPPANDYKNEIEVARFAADLVAYKDKFNGATWLASSYYKQNASVYLDPDAFMSYTRYAGSSGVPQLGRNANTIYNRWYQDNGFKMSNNRVKPGPAVQFLPTDLDGDNIRSTGKDYLACATQTYNKYLQENVGMNHPEYLKRLDDIARNVQNNGYPGSSNKTGRIYSKFANDSLGGHNSYGKPNNPLVTGRTNYTDGIWTRLYKGLIKPYFPEAKSMTGDHAVFNYSIWGQAPKGTVAYPWSEADRVYGTSGASIFTNTVVLDEAKYNLVKQGATGAESLGSTFRNPNQAELNKGVMKMFFITDDFGAAYLNHCFIGYVWGAQYMSYRTIDPSCFNAPVGGNSTNTLKVYALDHIRGSADTLVGPLQRVGVGAMYAMVYMHPKTSTKLVPEINTSHTDVVSSGDVVDVTKLISGSPTSTVVAPTGPTTWVTTKLVYPPGVDPPSNRGSDLSSRDNPCGRYGGYSDCTELDTWRSGTPFQPDEINAPNKLSHMENYTVDIPIGGHVCFMVSANPALTNDVTSWAHSKLVCLTVVKKPKVQFHGADVRSGDRVSINKSESNGSERIIYGSWSEYGLLASRPSTPVASGGRLSSGPDGARGLGSERDYNNLTFANTPNFGGFGAIPRTSLSPVITTGTGSAAVSGSKSVDQLSGGSNKVNRWKAAGNITITGGEVPAGKTVIINSTGTVTISGDIRYANGPFNNIGDIPQMVINARNIVITAEVKDVNSWLVALNGSISTCGSVSGAGWLGAIDIGACNSDLRINGPVVTEKLYLARVFGAENDTRHLPAEIINLRPDAYLWSKNMARSGGAIKTGYLKELPPRF